MWFAVVGAADCCCCARLLLSLVLLMWLFVVDRHLLFAVVDKCVLLRMVVC